MISFKKTTPLLLLITVIIASAFVTACVDGLTTTTEIQNNTTPAGTTLTTTTTITTTPQPASSIPATPSEEQARQLLKDARQTIVNARKYRFQESFLIDMKSSAFLGSMKIETNAGGAYDKIKDQSLMTIAMNVDMGVLQGKQALNLDIFRMTNYIYVKMDAGGLSIVPWVKTRPTAELIDSLNADMFENDLKSMDSPAEVTYLMDENVNGTDYWVIKFVPGADYLRESIGEQAGASSEIEWAKITDIRTLFKALSYKVWIAKDTKYIYKMDFVLSFELTKDLFIDPKEATDLTAVITGTLSMHDLNVEFSVNLPPEAQNAKEVSPEDLEI